MALAEDRDRIINVNASARTPAEIDAARCVAARWLRDHPDEYGILMDGEQVQMIAEALRIADSQRP